MRSQTLRDGSGRILDLLTQREPHEIVRLQSLVDQAGIPLTAVAALPPQPLADEQHAPPPHIGGAAASLPFQLHLQRNRCNADAMPAPIAAGVSAAASLSCMVQAALVMAAAGSAQQQYRPHEPHAELARAATAVRTSVRDRRDLLPPGGASGFLVEAVDVSGGGGGGSGGGGGPPRPFPPQRPGGGGSGGVHTLGGLARRGAGGPAGWRPVSDLPPEEQDAAMQGMFGNEYGESRVALIAVICPSLSPAARPLPRSAPDDPRALASRQPRAGGTRKGTPDAPLWRL